MAETECNICRSLLSKLVGTEDVGKIYTVLAFCQSLLPLAGVPFFNFTYRATVRSLACQLANAKSGYTDFVPEMEYLHLGACDNVSSQVRVLSFWSWCEIRLNGTLYNFRQI